MGTPPPEKKILHLNLPNCQVWPLFRYANKCSHFSGEVPSLHHYIFALPCLPGSWAFLPAVLKNTHPRQVHVAQKWLCIVQTVLSFQGPLLSSLWLGVKSPCGLQSRAWLYMCKWMACTVSWAHASALPYCDKGYFGSQFWFTWVARPYFPWACSDGECLTEQACHLWQMGSSQWGRVSVWGYVFNALTSTK